MASQVAPQTREEKEVVERFLGSSFFAESDAAPVVEKLLTHACPADERRALEEYAAEEEEHARLLAELMERKGIAAGTPFVIQKLFHLPSSRASILCETYHVEMLAATFYGALARKVRDPEVRALLERILRDEAGHIRLHRELWRREVAKLSGWRKLGARAFAFVVRHGMRLTAWLQAKQLEPVLGEAGKKLPAKIARHYATDHARVFAPTRSASPSLALAG